MFTSQSSCLMGSWCSTIIAGSGKCCGELGSDYIDLETCLNRLTLIWETRGRGERRHFDPQPALRAELERRQLGLFESALRYHRISHSLLLRVGTTCKALKVWDLLSIAAKDDSRLNIFSLCLISTISSFFIIMHVSTESLHQGYRGTFLKQLCYLLLWEEDVLL